jgi:hypothetical protein
MGRLLFLKTRGTNQRNVELPTLEGRRKKLLPIPTVAVKA